MGEGYAQVTVRCTQFGVCGYVVNGIQGIGSATGQRSHVSFSQHMGQKVWGHLHVMRQLSEGGNDLAGRRFNKAVPDRSLFLLKTSGQRPHVGGVVTRPGEPYYEIFRSWVADGATADFESARVQSIEVFPKSPVLPLAGMRQQMAVLAGESFAEFRGDGVAVLPFGHRRP